MGCPFSSMPRTQLSRVLPLQSLGPLLDEERSNWPIRLAARIESGLRQELEVRHVTESGEQLLMTGGFISVLWDGPQDERG